MVFINDLIMNTTNYLQTFCCHRGAVQLMESCMAKMDIVGILDRTEEEMLNKQDFRMANCSNLQDSNLDKGGTMVGALHSEKTIVQLNVHDI